MFRRCLLPAGAFLLCAFAVLAVVQPGENARPIRVGAISPHEFGAVGDGLADDTAAIQSAIAAAGANGTIAFSPGRVYRVTQTLAANVPGQTFRGNGAVLRRAPNAPACILALIANHCTVIGLEFDGRRTSAEPSLLGGALIDIRGNHATVRSCELHDASGCAIQAFGDVRGGTISGNRISRTFCGIFLDDAAGKAPSGFRIVGNSIEDGLGSPLTPYSGAIKISGTGSAASHAGHVVLRNTITKPGQMGIELQTWVNGCRIEGNRVEGAGHGISLSGVANCLVVRNVVNAATDYAYEIASGSMDCALKSNLADCRDASGGPLTRVGILCSQESFRCDISDNRVLHAASKALHILDGRHLRVTGNHLQAGDVCLYNQNSDHLTIAGNVLEGPANYHIFIDFNGRSLEAVGIRDNRLLGAAALDNVILYNGGQRTGITGFVFEGNDLSGATAVGVSFRRPDVEGN